MRKLMIANRGEVAIRIARTAAEMGLETVGIYSSDDAGSLHVQATSCAVPLEGRGVTAYLDGSALVAIARAQGCDAVHPGYGFLSESAAFAGACAAADLDFVGPPAAILASLGDKVAARQLAVSLGVPVLPGISRAVSVEEAADFLRSLGPGRSIMLKALAGGGGRGLRPVSSLDELSEAYARCASEAQQAFGSPELFVEELFAQARHVEVQIIGDSHGGVAHLWDRECSLQRQRQKLIEMAPAVGVGARTREALREAAVAMARASDYCGLGTMEFLVDARPDTMEPAFIFMEANPRLQVEHTVTEEVLGLDLVRLQLQIARGATLADLGLGQVDTPAPRGVAIQARVNLELMSLEGVRPAGGVLERYDPPAGPGVRVDGFGYAGYETSSLYDPLIAKVIAHAGDVEAAQARLQRALAEFRLEGAGANLGFLQAILATCKLSCDALHTRYVEDNLEVLLAAQSALAEVSPSLVKGPSTASALDPLAVLSARPSQGESMAARPVAQSRVQPGPPGAVAVTAPLQGAVVCYAVAPGGEVRVGQTVTVVDALKMEHSIPSPLSGLVRALGPATGTTVREGDALLWIEPAEVTGGALAQTSVPQLDHIRPDLARVERLHELTRDAARVDAIARRRALGKRTARENIAELCEPGSFMEYGPLVTPGRRWGETAAELEARVLKAPGDGLVMGIGRVNPELVGAERSRCVAMAYDYTVFAGTQGTKNHHKTDRMLDLAEQQRLPVVFFTEGGGGRTGGYPGDPPPPPTSTGGLKVATWRGLARLSGWVPLVGIASGRCFAGNAVVLSLCDVIIATRDSTIGIGGPAMIEGGGLGIYAPEEVGPVDIQEPNGVIDILVEDEAEAAAAARRYLSYFQGRVADWTVADQRPLRHMVPENRRAPYDVRGIVATVADEGSMLELRHRFGAAIVTALVRVEGRPVGVIANNSSSPTGGALDADAADKAARFMQLCDAFDIPILTLLDIPGNMVGPEAERKATVRHCGRLYVTGANLTTPMFSVVLRKAYGLGALAMTGGGFQFPRFVVSWPTGEFAGMGLEGQVKLGRRAELQAIEDLTERRARYEAYVASAYEWASAINGATVFEFDDVIDPAETRRWIAMGLESAPRRAERHGKKRGWIDTW